MRVSCSSAFSVAASGSVPPAPPPTQRPGGHGKYRSDGPTNSAGQAGWPLSPTAPGQQQAAGQRRDSCPGGQQQPGTPGTACRRAWDPLVGPDQPPPEASGWPTPRHPPALPQRSSGRRRSSRAAGRWPPGQPPTGPDDWGVGDQHPLDGVADLVLLFGGVDQRHEDPEDPGGDQGPLGLPGDLFQVDVSDAAQRGALVVHHGLVPPAARRLYRRSWHGPHRSLSG